MISPIDFQSKIKKLKLDWYNSLKRGVYYSIISHLILLIVVQILLGLKFSQSTKIRIKKVKQFAVELKQIEETKPPITIQGLIVKDTIEVRPGKILFAGIEIDTAGLINRYEENTLNVSVLFPEGWNYLDNFVKDIIDGVIFIPGENSDYDKRLSVLIQVNTNKNLFNPALYDSSFTYNRVNYYISRPQKTYEQITQVVYIRTGSFRADFIIKLTSPNEIEFKKFQPVFFAMVRSFSAGY
jgi:hypothetical protein